ncbi:sigma factor-like helix-turn-helix DNA-binding protein [Arthrobacter sp. GCM10027362]|uniref:sigma factor-like helix-turn-helix DNA-binding protein n=1 Tax=Arthrobacter sp. GCM10027362 TaxID=3273379 RepID=UPI00363EBDA6
MFVLTVDQRRSRSREDLVESAMAALNRDPRRPLRLAFDRTAGDEMQGVTDSAAIASGIALELASGGQWSVGIGIGGIREPLPANTRAGAGEAFERARAAVTAAKAAPGNIAVSGASPLAGQAEAVLQLVSSVARKRSKLSAEAGLLVDEGLTQREVADRLGISQQAVSSRLHSGLWHECQRAAEVATSLLEGADT